MRTALQVTSWIMVVLGVLAFAGAEGDSNVLIGTSLIIVQAVLTLVYLKKEGDK